MFNSLMKVLRLVFDKAVHYLVVILLLVLAMSLVRGLIRADKARDRIHEAEDRVEELRRENEALEAKLEFVRSEEFTEQQIRDKLGLAKEGEIVVILPEDDVVRKLAPIYYEEIEEALPDPNWRKWANLFL